MINKYKVSDIAKDLEMTSKEVVDMLSKFSDAPKKAATNVEERELDLLFETLTQNRKDDLKVYFDEVSNRKPTPKKEEKPAKKTTKKVVEKVEEKAE